MKTDELWLVEFVDGGGEERRALARAGAAAEAAILAHEVLFGPADGEDGDPWNIIGDPRVLHVSASGQACVVDLGVAAWTRIPLPDFVKAVLDRRDVKTSDAPSP